VKKDRLFEQFPPVTASEWMQKIKADLKGADFTEKLVWKSNEGFDVMPFYRMEDIENLPWIGTLPGEFPYLRGNKTRNNSWLVRQNIEVTDYFAANRKALIILMKGIDSIGFTITDPESVSGDNIDILLKDIHLENIELNFFCNGKAVEILDILKNTLSERSLDKDNLHGAIEADPLGRLILKGTLCVPVEAGFDYLASLTAKASELTNLRTIHLNASHFSNAGSGIVRELAYGLSAGSEYLVQLTNRGVPADLAASKIRFSFGTGPDYFMEIARLRAARLLWSLIIKGFIPEGYTKIKMDIHCVTGRWNKTIYDPYVNMLRTQTEAMSAILGGADSLTVEPYDNIFRKPDEFSERIARNQQLILKEEAFFDKVADPSAGSYYIEKLTSLVAGNAWKLFLEIEDQGGFLSAIRSGFIQGKISESADMKKEAFQTGKVKLLGSNLFPDLNEKVLSQIDPDRVFKSEGPESDLLIEPIRLFRLPEEYEAARLDIEKGAKN
jgi:methylmalonyl-CoA mutase